MSYFDELKNNNTEFAIYQEIYNNYLKTLSEDDYAMLYNRYINSNVGKNDYVNLLRKRKIKRLL